jgi:serine/threonine protein kinase
MSEVPSERDDRLAVLLTEALDIYRSGGTVDLAALQARHPDIAGELPDLLDTLLNLDTAVEDWKAIASPETRAFPAGAETSGPAGAPTVPAQVGRYRILGAIGQGGMGTVYRAEDPQLQRVVALKVPRFEGSERMRETAVKRFLREARAMAQVRHPHVCPIHDVGEQDGVPYVVMEYVDGQSLADRLSDGRRYDDPTEAVRLVRQVAEALEAVHARGLVHRDLKPGNVLIDTSGRAVLTDFGLARSDQDVEHLTADGTLIGTPAYMAPEQASLTAGPVGPSTDVYSLGVVLYQMLTGRLPFEGPLLKVIYSIAHESPPPLRRFREDVDSNLEGIVLKAMAGRAEERYAGARDFADALGRWAPGSPPSVAEHSSAQKPAHVERPPTVVQSTLPDGSVVTVSLQPGAAVPKKLNLAVREGRTRKKGRVVAVSLSISFAVVLALVIGTAGLAYLAQHQQSAGRQQVALAPPPKPETTPVKSPGAGVIDHTSDAETPQGGGNPLPPEVPPKGGTSDALPPAPAAGAAPTEGGPPLPALPAPPVDLHLPHYVPRGPELPNAPAAVLMQSMNHGVDVRRVFGEPPPFGSRAGAPLNQGYYHLALSGPAVQSSPPYPYAFNAPPSGASPSVAAFFYAGGASGVSSGGVGATTNTTPYGPGYSAPYASSVGIGGYPAEARYNPYDVSTDPYGGGLRGVAGVIGPHGQFPNDFQQARVFNQEVERSTIEARRKIYDEWLYERANTPTVVAVQERTQKLEERRVMLGMPLSEILSGSVLNALLDDLKRIANLKDVEGPIEPEVLRQINVISQKGGGNVGVLKPVKEGRSLTWPRALQDAAYQDEVRRLNQKAAEAVKLVQNAGQVDPGTLNDMKDDLRRLRSKVSAHIDDLTPPQSIEANRFLNQLDDGVKGLAQPDVANSFSDTFAAKGKTVPDLVQFMASKGLKFAPATAGDEAAYQALYDRLVKYALQVNRAGDGGR